MGLPRSGIKTNVDPKLAAIAILLVLSVVQIVWWKGLVSINRGKPGQGGQQGGGGGPPDTYIVGLPEAEVETMAGAADPGDRDGIGRDARFDSPSGIAPDRHGGLYVADTRNNRIRYVSSDGRTQTVCGREAGYRDGAAGQALFRGPTGIVVTANDVVYVSDTLNHRIRRIHEGVVDTMAGGEAGMADGSGEKARFNLPAALSLIEYTDACTIVIADSGNHRVRELSMNPMSYKSVKTASVLNSAPTSAHVSRDGAVAALPDKGSILIGAKLLKDTPVELGEYRGVIPDGSIALRQPVMLAPAPDGWYAADGAHAAVMLVSHGTAKVVAGVAKKSVGPMIGFRDGSGDKAAFGLISGIATDSAGTIYVADASNNAIRKIRLNGSAPRPEQDRRAQWHPGEDYRAPAIRSSQGRDTGKSDGVFGARYVKPGGRKQ